jgi:hypothetical protein
MRARSPKEIAAAARAEHKARRASLRTRIRSLDDLIAAPDVVAALDLEMLRRQRDDLQNLVTRLSEQLRSREWLYIGILQLAENDGADLGYTTMPHPHGPGIELLRREAARCGYAIGPRQAQRLLQVFSALPRAGSKLGGTSSLGAHAGILRRGHLVDE